MEESKANYSYWKQLRRAFFNQRINRWAIRLLVFLFFIAVTGDFIANEKPLVYRKEGKLVFPILKTYAVDLGWSKPDPDLFNKNWAAGEYDYVLFPPIPYSASTIDISNNNFVSPFEKQKIKSWRWRHWLGTDFLGRDIAAGMIKGTRTALSVGLIAMSIALLIGLFLGLLAGYFGDDQYRIPLIQLLLLLLMLPFALFYGFISRTHLILNGYFAWEIAKSTFLFLGLLFLAAALGSLLGRLSFFKRRIRIPLDSLVMRAVEIVSSLPGLLLILAILAVVKKPSIFYIMLIIGFLRWTGITRYIRSELLRIRQLDYIQAARALGFSNWRILLRHALPNGIRPVLITVSFGMASAILLEAFISFLGVGLPPENVSWGSMLKATMDKRSWLAVFPGMGIFLTVTIFNLIGDGLTKALEAK